MLISLIVTLIIVGLLLWAVTQIPMDNAIRQVIRVIVIVFAVLYAVRMLFPGALHGIW